MNNSSTKRWLTIFISLIILSTMVFKAQPAVAQTDEFPQINAWYQATPSVVWCNDPTSTTTLEVHITGRNDVSRVWLTELGTGEEEGRAELFDNATYGDVVAGDNIFTLSDVVLPCNLKSKVIEPGFTAWLGFLRVELKDGSLMGNNYGMMIGQVDPKYKNAFEVQDFGNGLSATAYAFFIEDTNHEVINSYPVSDVVCGTSNFTGYTKFYSVMPDDFDFAVLMPGMPIFRTKDLAENVPYAVSVSNDIENIGWDIFSNAQKFGSGGRLRSAIYYSFGGVDVLDHELGHAWMAGIGQSLGLMHENYSGVLMGHWNKMADMQGQMGAYYFGDNDAVGHFAYNGDETWRMVPNTTIEPYSPLELYLMGLIPAEEVPDIHILENPDLTDPQRITAASYKTVTIEEIIASVGGERIPAYEDAQKAFNLAFIVTQDMPYNDAAYAYFSLVSHSIASVEAPTGYSDYAPFRWATGNRAIVNTRLPLDLAAPGYIPGDPTPTAAPTATKEPAATDLPAPTNTAIPEVVEPQPTTLPAVVEEPVEQTSRPWLWGAVISVSLIGLVVLVLRGLRKRS